MCAIQSRDGDACVSISKIRKVGGSLVVTIPRKLVDAMKLREGELVEITLKKVRIDGFGAFKGMKPFTAEDELDTHD
jgi:antitoxin component of MazEF toxin-antitoxin module